MIEIYPGYKISNRDYKKRFNNIDLDYFKRMMPPGLFKAFVRTAGSIDGHGIELEELFNGK